MTMTLDSEREAFEKWFAGEFPHVASQCEKGVAAAARDAREMAWAGYKAAHLTQPAQAVDVEVLHACDVALLFCETGAMRTGWSPDRICRAFEKLRALGNAQAEGWKVPDVDWLADQLCDLRNKWAESCEANWLETDDNHPDDWMAKELHKRLIASPTPPQHGQPEPPCSLDEALAVIDAWASHGGQVHGAAAARLRSLTDRIAPLHGQPCDVGDEVIETFRMLRAEKQRMDFIEAHPGWLSVRRHKRKTLWLCAPFSNYEQDLHATARDAIDAALAAQPTQPAEGE